MTEHNRSCHIPKSILKIMKVDNKKTIQYLSSTESSREIGPQSFPSCSFL